MLVQNFSFKKKKMKKKKKTSHHQYLMKFFHFFIINSATYQCRDSFSNFGITVDSEVSGTNKSLVSVNVE